MSTATSAALSATASISAKTSSTSSSLAAPSSSFAAPSSSLTAPSSSLAAPSALPEPIDYYLGASSTTSALTCTVLSYSASTELTSLWA